MVINSTQISEKINRRRTNSKSNRNKIKGQIYITIFKVNKKTLQSIYNYKVH